MAYIAFTPLLIAAAMMLATVRRLARRLPRAAAVDPHSEPYGDAPSVPDISSEAQP